MRNYYSIDGKLYTLTNKQKKQLEKLYQVVRPTEEEHEARLQWIENYGRFIGPCENLAY